MCLKGSISADNSQESFHVRGSKNVAYPSHIFLTTCRIFAHKNNEHGRASSQAVAYE